MIRKRQTVSIIKRKLGQAEKEALDLAKSYQEAKAALDQAKERLKRIAGSSSRAGVCRGPQNDFPCEAGVGPLQ